MENMIVIKCINRLLMPDRQNRFFSRSTIQEQIENKMP